jgi:hypothetical protein
MRAALTLRSNVNCSPALRRPVDPHSDLRVGAVYAQPQHRGEDNTARQAPRCGGFYDQKNCLQLLKPRLNGWGFCLIGTCAKTKHRT